VLEPNAGDPPVACCDEGKLQARSSRGVALENLLIAEADRA
jgi:hypothetical protein